MKKIIAAVWAMAATLAAQGTNASEVNALMQKQDWAAAAPLLRNAVRENPADGASWFRLGTCLHRLNQEAESREAYQKAMALKFQGPQATAAVARSYAKEGNAALATEWLEKAADAGYAGIAFVDGDPDFAGVKGNAGFAKARARIDAAAHPCMSTPEYRQFDFWIGEWTVDAQAGSGIATSRIESLMDGCIVQENWMPQNGPGGKSWNFYDPATRKWSQVWVAPGGTLRLEGGLRDGSMWLEGVQSQPGGGKAHVRIVWTPLPGHRVRQLYERSTDEGKTWVTAFDGTYRPTAGK